MILDPINDVDCLGQLTRIARELVPTTAIQSVAKRLGSRDAIVRWLQSLPQADDHGDERVRFIQCDVPQRARLLPDDPNCVERAVGALMLLEVVDASTPRALATVERPARHTGLVEQHGARWYAVDLFPRRNVDWGGIGKDVLRGVHAVGKPLLTAYGLGGVADLLGKEEDTWMGTTPQKKSSPPPGGAREAPQAGAGAASGPTGRGGHDAQAREAQDGARGAASVLVDGGTAATQDRDRRDPHDAKEAPQRFWWLGG